MSAEDIWELAGKIIAEGNEEILGSGSLFFNPLESNGEHAILDILLRGEVS